MLQISHIIYLGEYYVNTLSFSHRTITLKNHCTKKIVLYCTIYVFMTSNLLKIKI